MDLISGKKSSARIESAKTQTEGEARIKRVILELEKKVMDVLQRLGNKMPEVDYSFVEKMIDEKTIKERKMH